MRAWKDTTCYDVFHTYAVPSRAEIKKALMEQCHGSVEEAKKLLSELNKKAYCKGATNFDRKRYSVMSNVYRKMQKEPAAEKEGNNHYILLAFFVDRNT